MQTPSQLEEVPFQQKTIQPSLGILQLLQGLWINRSVHVAINLGLADLLKDGPKSIQTLADTTNTHAPSLYRLLRSLASLGLFTEIEPKCFAQTELSDALCSDRLDSIYRMAELCGQEWQLRIWENLEYSIRTGKSSLEHIYHQNIWEFLNANPAEAKLFDLAMTSLSTIDNQPVAQSYDFSHFDTLVDIGGGHGSLLTTILSLYPTLKGVLFDQPQVIESAHQHIKPELQDRIRLVGGDFFTTISQKSDAFIMKQIIHAFDDESCIKILKNCRQAIKPEGKILIVDRVVQPGEGEETTTNKYWDLYMLVVTAGHERTAEEFSSLYSAAGFQLTRIIPTGTFISIIEGIPVEQ